jgi:hypothetical protein
MIEKSITETFKLNINDIFRLCIDNNNDMIKEIKEVVVYNQGIWKDNIKKDKITIKLNDIPKEIPESLIKMVMNDDETIINKIKITLIERTDSNIILKIKVKPIAHILFKINNLLKLSTTKAYISIIQMDDMAVINAKYKIKVLFPNANYNDIIENYMEKILNTLFINNMINYLKVVEMNI